MTRTYLGHSGYGLTFIPFSWALGVWRKPHKTIYALGPLRFTSHRDLGDWKPAKAPFEPNPMRGEWLGGFSPSDLLADGSPAGGALEPNSPGVELRTQGRSPQNERAEHAALRV